MVDVRIGENGDGEREYGCVVGFFAGRLSKLPPIDIRSESSITDPCCHEVAFLSECPGDIGGARPPLDAFEPVLIGCGGSLGTVLIVFVVSNGSGLYALGMSK
jgi:hypothetical protein